MRHTHFRVRQDTSGGTKDCCGTKCEPRRLRFLYRSAKCTCSPGSEATSATTSSKPFGVQNQGATLVARQNSDLLSDQVGGLCTCFGMYPCKTVLMVRLLRLLSIVPTRFFRSRCDLLLENLALRQQLGVFKRKHPRPRLAATDKLFWVMLRRLWAGWSGALILVQPETVVRWHRKGFRLYWTWLSRRRKIETLKREIEEPHKSPPEKQERRIDLGIAERSIVHFQKAFELEQRISH